MEPMREINAAETIISFKREVKIPQLATSLVGRVNRISQVAPTANERAISRWERSRHVQSYFVIC